MRRKLRSRRGETLVETLAAILIVTLASLVLMTMLAAAARINTAAGAADADFRAALTAAENRETALEPAPGGDAPEIDIEGYAYPIAFYGEAEGLRAYALAPESPEGGAGP